MEDATALGQQSLVAEAMSGWLFWAFDGGLAASARSDLGAHAVRASSY